MLESLLLTEREQPSAWVESHLNFPSSTSPNAPGPLSFERTPYLREIIDCIADPNVENVYVSGGSQIGKSALLIAMLGYMIAQRPANGMWAMTSLEQVKGFSRKRLMPFIRNNPCLAQYIKQADPSAFKESHFDLKHMAVRFVGTGSPANLASESCAWIIADEAAKWPHNIKNEAPPIQLIKERTKGFPRRFHLFTSTPTTIENEFWQGFCTTDMRQFYMPCPHCGEDFAFEFKRETMKWDRAADGSIDIDLAAETVRYICPNCGGEIREGQKLELMSKGVWKPSPALQKEFASERVRASSRDRGYHLDSLYSPFLSWGKCVRAFLECYTSVLRAIELQNFRNSWCALPYEQTRISVKSEDITALCGTHRRGQVPGEPYYVAVGYDPGGNETHWVACAVYEGGKMLVIDWGTILMFRTESRQVEGPDGETRTQVDRPGIAPHFDSLQWPAEDGGEPWRPMMGFVDAGYCTGDIYAECMMLPGTLVPTKGAGDTIGTFYARDAGGAYPGLRVLQYSDHHAKTSLYARTMAYREAPHLVLPLVDDCDPEFVKGLSGQRMVRKGARDVWRDVPDDHFGDCIKIQRVGWWALCRRFEDSPILPDPVEDGAVQTEGQ